MQACRGRESQWRRAQKGREGEFVSAGDWESRVKGEVAKDAETWQKGTTKIGKLPEIAVQISQKPGHLCYPECFNPIVNRIKIFPF